jgi:hypothetical protein
MKHWYINQISLVPLIFTTNRIIKSVAISIPFGVCVSVSPAAGIIALSLLLFFFVENIKMSWMDVYLGSKLYDLSKKMIHKKIEKKYPESNIQRVA